MATYNIASDNISVYPSSRRGAQKPESRLLTESALVSIVNKLIDTDGFVITRTLDLQQIFEFNIHGYYFKVDPASSLTALFPDAEVDDVIYGIIKMVKLSENIVELDGQDEDGSYTGVQFSLTPTSDLDSYQLALLVKNNAGWSIVEDSKFKFAASSSQSSNVDGGEI